MQQLSTIDQCKANIILPQAKSHQELHVYFTDSKDLSQASSITSNIEITNNVNHS